MKDKDRIKEGDIVNVHWDTETLFGLELIFKPEIEGNLWIFKGVDGAIHYIESFTRITRESSP